MGAILFRLTLTNASNKAQSGTVVLKSGSSAHGSFPDGSQTEKRLVVCGNTSTGTLSLNSRTAVTPNSIEGKWALGGYSSLSVTIGAFFHANGLDDSKKYLSAEFRPILSVIVAEDQGAMLATSIVTQTTPDRNVTFKTCDNTDFSYALGYRGFQMVQKISELILLNGGRPF